MTGLQEVPTDELLSFQDFPPVHNPSSFSSSTATSTIPVLIDSPKESDRDFNDFQKGAGDIKNPLEEDSNTDTKSFWTLKYYQKFFDVDTSDVIERIVASIIPRRTDFSTIKSKPDLYGPFWISITLIFTIAISGNVANYLQHANSHYHWKYNFHLVSYAATAIILYISLVPFLFWALLKWSSEVTDLDGLEDGTVTGPLQLICIYGYSLFIYIPVSMLCSIQVGWFQWLLVVIAATLSGSVLIYTLMPALRLSRHKLLLILGVICCHLLLAAGVMLYFFHDQSAQDAVKSDIKGGNSTSKM